MYLGTIIICTGIIITVIACRNVKPPHGGIAELKHLWSGNLYWHVYLGLVVFCGGTLYYLHSRYQQAVDSGRLWPYYAYVLPVSFAITSALFGTMSVVFAKIIAIIFFSGKTSDFIGPSSYFFYLCIIAWILFAAVWLFRLNQALSLYNTLFIIPLLQASFIILANVSGGTYFNEYEQLTNVESGLYALGILLLIFGIVLVSPTLDQVDPASDSPALTPVPSAAPKRLSMSSASPPTGFSLTKQSILVDQLQPAGFREERSARRSVTLFRLSAVATLNDVHHVS